MLRNAYLTVPEPGCCTMTKLTLAVWAVFEEQFLIDMLTITGCASTTAGETVMQTQANTPATNFLIVFPVRCVGYGPPDIGLAMRSGHASCTGIADMRWSADTCPKSSNQPMTSFSGCLRRDRRHPSLPHDVSFLTGPSWLLSTEAHCCGHHAGGAGRHGAAASRRGPEVRRVAVVGFETLGIGCDSEKEKPGGRLPTLLQLDNL